MSLRTFQHFNLMKKVVWVIIVMVFHSICCSKCEEFFSPHEGVMQPAQRFKETMITRFHCVQERAHERRMKNVFHSSSSLIISALQIFVLYFLAGHEIPFQ
jgi:hypothetical protein